MDREQLLAGVTKVNGKEVVYEEHDSESTAQGSATEVVAAHDGGGADSSVIPGGSGVADKAAVPASKESLQSYLERTLHSLCEEKERLEFQLDAATNSLKEIQIDIDIAYNSLKAYDDRRNRQQNEAVREVQDTD